MKQGYVYIMASQKNGTLYIGVTNDLLRRVSEHKDATITGFTKKYRCHLLVWYEACDDIVTAIAGEKRLKKLGRAQKLKLIETDNLNWRDLSVDLI